MALSIARIESSNLPAGQKSAIRQWYERTMGTSGGLARAKAGVISTGAAVRQGGESLFVGGALGAAHVYLKQGLDMGKVPLDGVGGLAALAGSVAMAGEPVAEDLRNAGASALSVFAFRKTFELLGKKRQQSGQPIGGALGPKAAGEFGEDFGEDFGADGDGEDPIIAAARAL